MSQVPTGSFPDRLFALTSFCVDPSREQKRPDSQAPRYPKPISNFQWIDQKARKSGDRIPRPLSRGGSKGEPLGRAGTGRPYRPCLEIYLHNSRPLFQIHQRHARIAPKRGGQPEFMPSFKIMSFFKIFDSDNILT